MGDLTRATAPRNARKTDWEEVGVAVEHIYRPSAAIGVVVGVSLVI